MPSLRKGRGVAAEWNYCQAWAETVPVAQSSVPTAAGCASLLAAHSFHLAGPPSKPMIQNP